MGRRKQRRFWEKPSSSFHPLYDIFSRGRNGQQRALRLSMWSSSSNETTWAAHSATLGDSVGTFTAGVIYLGLPFFWVSDPGELLSAFLVFSFLFTALFFGLKVNHFFFALKKRGSKWTAFEFCLGRNHVWKWMHFLMFLCQLCWKIAFLWISTWVWRTEGRTNGRTNGRTQSPPEMRKRIEKLQ